MTVTRMLVDRLWGDSNDWGRFDWRPFRPGVEMAELYGEGEGTASAALLRYAPGAAVPKHLHTGIEHILVLEGSQRDDRGTYTRGSMLIHGPGTSHAVASDFGCVVLAIWERPVEIL